MMEEKILSSFMDGSNIFESTGYSVIKVSKNGVSQAVKIPIRTSGVDELQKRLAKQAPLPPVTRETIKSDSPEGVRLGLEADQVKMVFDYTDKDYLEKLEKHGAVALFHMVIKGLDVKWPSHCDSIEKKVALLKSQGITDNQLVKIYRDIQMLTIYQEGREDFLPAG